MFSIDVKRPFKTLLARLQQAGFLSWVFSFFGFFATRNHGLERAIRVAKTEAKLSKSIVFLNRTQRITLSYRKEAFFRIKDRNAQRIQESVRKGKVKVIFNSNPVEFKKDSVVLEMHGKTQKIANDFVWIFAGGEPPTAFLKKIGVGFGAQDITTAASKEAQTAKEAALALP